MQLCDFLQQIQFKTCQPNQPLPMDCSAEFEFENTCFPEPYDFLLKQSFLPLQDIPKMSTLAIAGIIHACVEQMPADQVYLNIGIWFGYTLFAGMLNHPEKQCIGVDDFSQTFAEGSARETFHKNFQRFASPQHQFHELDYQTYFKQSPPPPIGVYFYDGHHGYQHQLQGLQIAEPYLAPNALILIDDTNWFEPLQATDDFLYFSQNKYKKLCHFKTHENTHPTFWNGLLLLQKQD